MLLKEPIQIGGLTLKNRLVMPPMASGKSSEGGLATDELLEHYGSRARGGDIGLIITEHAFVTQRGKASSHQLSMADDRVIEDLRRLTDLIHRDGTKVFAQINHAGASGQEHISGMRNIAPSAVLNPGVKKGFDSVIPRAMTREEIKEAEEAFIRASERALLAGYDGVEIHCAHAYLLNQFYSPVTNRREDEYGGTLENRIRITVEILRAVKEIWGGKGPVAVRLGAFDYMEGGNTEEDAAAAARILEENGCDLLDVTGGMCRYSRPGHSEPGYFSDASAVIRKAVSIPVNVTGGVKKASQAEELLLAGACDMTGVGRAILEDKDWAKKEMNRI